MFLAGETFISPLPSDSAVACFPSSLISTPAGAFAFAVAVCSFVLSCGGGTKPVHAILPDCGESGGIDPPFELLAEPAMPGSLPLLLRMSVTAPGFCP